MMSGTAGTFLRVEVQGRGRDRELVPVRARQKDPGRGKVRVRVRYVGVAYGDVMRRRGVLAPPIDFVPGYDVVGVVDAVGAGVRSGAAFVGQRVAAMMPMTGFGAYAESVTLPASALVPIPDGVSDRDAIGFGLNAITALQILDRFAPARAGETVLVHGAAGGVGTALLDVAAWRGVRVLGTASAGKHAWVRARGGEPIDYRSEDFVAVTRERTGGEGAHVVVDGIGGEHLRESARALRRGGKLVALGVSGDVSGGLMGVAAGMRHVAAIRARGVWVGNYAITASRGCGPAACRADWARLMAARAEGSLRAPSIGAVIPLVDAASAHEALETASVRGKILLDAAGEEKIAADEAERVTPAAEGATG